MKLTISGEPASGKGTIGRKLAEHYNLTYAGLGDLKRKEATRRGMSIQEFDHWTTDNPVEGDKAFDDMQRTMADTQDNFIMDGWLSFYCAPKAINILLRCSAEVAGKRVYADVKSGKRTTEAAFADVKDAIKITQERYHANQKRWKALYGIDIYQDEDFDLIVDTSDASINEVFAVLTHQINEITAQETQSTEDQ